MSILSKYLSQVKEERDLEEIEGINLDDINVSDSEKEQLIKEIKRIREDPNDIANRFHNEYKSISENDLDIKGLTSEIKVSVKIKRAFCPNCGKELISKSNPINNSYNVERIAKHECECGYKANLEYAYPRVMFIDENGVEIKGFIN